MPLDPTLDELAQGSPPQQPPQGLPPPQPTPYGVVRAQEHQQRWGGTPDIGAGLQDIAASAGRGALGAVKGFNETIGQMATGTPEEQGQASGRFIENALGFIPFGGVEKGALGALRMSRVTKSEAIRNPHVSEHSFDLISKETSNPLGTLDVKYNSFNNELYVSYLKQEKRVIEKGKLSWGIGTHELQTLGPELSREFPNVKTVSFYRVPVGRGTSREMKFEVVRDQDGAITGWNPIPATPGSIYARPGATSSAPSDWQTARAQAATAPPPSTAVRPGDPRSNLPPIAPPTPTEPLQHGPGWTRDAPPPDFGFSDQSLEDLIRRLGRL